MRRTAVIMIVQDVVTVEAQRILMVLVVEVFSCCFPVQVVRERIILFVESYSMMPFLR